MRERDNEYKRREKILVSTHGLANKVGGVEDKQVSFMRVGHGNEGKEEGEKMQSFSKWQGDVELQNENMFLGIAEGLKANRV